MEVQETKRLKHYNNKQKILLVGEGDFSFSLSLARAFGSATNLIATSLDSQGESITHVKCLNFVTILILIDKYLFLRFISINRLVVERFIMETERICMVRASHQLRYPEVTNISLCFSKIPQC